VCVFVLIMLLPSPPAHPPTDCRLIVPYTTPVGCLRGRVGRRGKLSAWHVSLRVCPFVCVSVLGGGWVICLVSMEGSVRDVCVARWFWLVGFV